MNDTINIPLTNNELANSYRDELQKFPCTFTHFWEVLKISEYTADFHQNQLIPKSYESSIHSEISTAFSYLLSATFTNREKFKVHSTNRPIYLVEGNNSSVFNPDGSVIAQPPIHFEYSPGMNAESTPILLFEVLSKSTRSYDFGTKLPLYKQIPTLNTIIYIETKKVSVLVMERESKNRWVETEYTQKNDFFIVNKTTIYLKDIYLDWID